MFLHLSKIITRKGGKKLCSVIACDTQRKESMLPRKLMIELLVTQDSNKQVKVGGKVDRESMRMEGKGLKGSWGAERKLPE